MSGRFEHNFPPRRRSAPVRIAAILALLVATGCANSALIDQTLGGGAELPAPGSEPDMIRRATGEETTWPNLATVPPRPTGFQTPAERQALLDRLRAGRDASIESGAELDLRAPIAPARQPPPSLPPMGGEVPPPASEIQIPARPPDAP